LKKGGGLHGYYLHDMTYIGEDSLKGFQMMSLGNFPAIFRSGAKEDCTVYGEVYEVTEDCLDDMDVAEGVPHLYRRERIMLELYGQVWAYVQNYPRDKESFERVMGGRWNLTGKTPMTKVLNGSVVSRPDPRKNRIVYNRETNEWIETDPMGRVVSRKINTDSTNPFGSKPFQQQHSHPLALPNPMRPPIVVEPVVVKKEEEEVDVTDYYWGKAARKGSSEEAKPAPEVVEKTWNGEDVMI